MAEVGIEAIDSRNTRQRNLTTTNLLLADNRRSMSALTQTTKALITAGIQVVEPANLATNAPVAPKRFVLTAARIWYRSGVGFTAGSLCRGCRRLFTMQTTEDAKHYKPGLPVLGFHPRN